MDDELRQLEERVRTAADRLKSLREQARTATRAAAQADAASDSERWRVERSAVAAAVREAIAELRGD